MSAHLLTEQQVRERLQAACDQAGSQRRFAESRGVRESLISDTLHAKRAPGATILTALGLVEVTRFADLRNSDGALGIGPALQESSPPFQGHL